MDKLDREKLELIQLKLAFQKKLDECFDPTKTDSRPSADQLAFLQDGDSKVIFVVAPNRVGKCLAEGTLVATPNGPIPIENIQIGDEVYDENGNIIRVKDTFNQGIKDVVDICHRGIVQATCTPDHIWQVETGRGRVVEKRLKNFKEKDKIKRTEVNCMFGNVNVPSAYALGALLGDGCSRESGIRKVISSSSHHIPMAITSNAVKQNADNYSWNLGRIDVAYYEEWCKDRYAHEKIINLDVVKEWDRVSIVKLLSGLIDTDGSISYNKRYNLLEMSISMQSKSCIEFVQWCLLALYQYNVTIKKDNRDEYKNGPCYYLRCRNTHVTRRLWKEIDEHINSPHKKYKKEYDVADSPRFNPNKIGITIQNKRKMQCYDLHVDSETNLYLLANGLVTHNTGVAARAISWWFQGIHPYVKPKAKWGDSYNILIVGRTTEIIETEIWEKKIKPFLPPGCWKPKHKSGGGLAGVKHLSTGINIVFMSHHDAKNAREKVQGFTAPIVWVDEMPDDSSLITELMLRTSTEGGLFMATFTPLVENEQIRKIVDAPAPGKRMYKFLPQDNPKLMEEFGGVEGWAAWLRPQCATEAEFRARMYGEWYYKSGRVIRAYDPAHHLIPTPKDYDRRVWNHMLVVDPSASGLTGVSLWAQFPDTEQWACVLAKKIEGDAAFILVQKIESMVAGCNIIKRLCDCNPAGFYIEARRQGVSYETMNDKVDRRNSTIEATNAKFANNAIYICSEGASDLADECMGAKWSETNPDKMINSTNYHLIDTLRYFVDRCPALSETKVVTYNNVSHMAKQEFKKQLKNREVKKEKLLQNSKKSYRIVKRSKNKKGGRRWG